MTHATPDREAEAVLAFDTSGAHCDIAILKADRVVAEAHAQMQRGQAERLMPMIADLLAEAHLGRRNLKAVAVGIGPGNFTGLRIAVAAARGLALGLGIPAIGVSSFAAMIEAEGLYGGSVLLSLPAPREQTYLQYVLDGREHGAPRLAALAEFEPGQVDLVVGHQAELIARDLPNAEAIPRLLERPAGAIARIAERRLIKGGAQPRPAPLYIRPPDAAPSRQAAPVILP